MGLVRGINFNNNFYFFDMGKKVLNNLAYAIPHTKIYDFLMRNKETLLYNENKGFFGKTRSYLVNLQWYTFLQHRIYVNKVSRYARTQICHNVYFSFVSQRNLLLKIVEFLDFIHT